MEIQHQLHYPLYSNLLPTGQYSHYTNNQIENSTIYSDILSNPVTMVGTGNLPSLTVNSNQEFPNHQIQTPLSNENFFNTSSISLPNGGENTSSTLLSTETYQPLAKIDNSNNSILNTSTSISSPNSTCDSNSNSSNHQNGPNTCAGCSGILKEKFIFSMNNQFWHSQCLRCEICSGILEQNPSCYMKDRKIYCKSCYDSKFYAKCSSCKRAIQSTDWVRKAQENVYHLACFSCEQCKRQLSTGEEFGLQNDKLLCKQHYMELFDGDGNSNKTKTKRVRTTFADEQISVLQAHFQLDSNPDGADLEKIANMTGLSKRVTQVWFQNSRARQKKYQGHKKGGNGTTNCISTSDELNSSPSLNRPESLRSHTLSTTSGRSSPRSVSSPKTYRDDVMECNNNGQDASFSNQNMSLNTVNNMDDRNNLISTSFNMDCD